MTTKWQATRHHVASVHKMNGAYLVGLMGPATDDATPDQLYDAAGSLATAKRLAVQGAREFGYDGAVRWLAEPDHPNLLWLEMTWTEQWEAYDDGE